MMDGFSVFHSAFFRDWLRVRSALIRCFWIWANWCCFSDISFSFSTCTRRAATASSSASFWRRASWMTRSCSSCSSAISRSRSSHSFFSHCSSSLFRSLSLEMSLIGGRLASKARFARIFSICSTSLMPAGRFTPYCMSRSSSTSGSSPRWYFSARCRCFSLSSVGSTKSGSYGVVWASDSR